MSRSRSASRRTWGPMAAGATSAVTMMARCSPAAAASVSRSVSVHAATASVRAICASAPRLPPSRAGAAHVNPPTINAPTGQPVMNPASDPAAMASPSLRWSATDRFAGRCSRPPRPIDSNHSPSPSPTPQAKTRPLTRHPTSRGLA